MCKNLVELVKTFTEGQRILICGKSGYGKSTLIKELIRQFHETYEIYVHDIKREYTDYPVYVFYDAETLKDIWEEKLKHHQETGKMKKILLILDEIRELKGKETIDTIESILGVGRAVGITTIGIAQKVVSKITYFIDATDYVIFFNTNLQRIKNSYFRLTRDEHGIIQKLKKFEYYCYE